uniref:Uncharacterized protein n=1 Tax=Romanomermis culicivorax TaxID=13658 RepID=A0A915IZN7_ROMCU
MNDCSNRTQLVDKFSAASRPKQPNLIVVKFEQMSKKSHKAFSPTKLSQSEKSLKCSKFGPNLSVIFDNALSVTQGQELTKPYVE